MLNDVALVGPFDDHGESVRSPETEGIAAFCVQIMSPLIKISTRFPASGSAREKQSQNVTLALAVL